MRMERRMDRAKIALISATVCIVLSVQAFLVEVLALTTGWDRGLKDEGVRRISSSF